MVGLGKGDCFWGEGIVREKRGGGGHSMERWGRESDSGRFERASYERKVGV